MQAAAQQVLMDQGGPPIPNGAPVPGGPPAQQGSQPRPPATVQ
jgi:hypothetical protein